MVLKLNDKKLKCLSPNCVSSFLFIVIFFMLSQQNTYNRRSVVIKFVHSTNKEWKSDDIVKFWTQNLYTFILCEKQCVYCVYNIKFIWDTSAAISKAKHFMIRKNIKYLSYMVDIVCKHKNQQQQPTLYTLNSRPHSYPKLKISKLIYSVNVGKLCFTCVLVKTARFFHFIILLYARGIISFHIRSTF